MNEPYWWVESQYKSVLGRIEDLAIKNNRSISEVSLMAVTKTHPWQAIEKAYDAGARLFGENRVQEMLERIPNPWPYADAHLSFIGHLQSNKVKKAAGLVHSVQSVDSASTLLAISKAANDTGRTIEVWFEVNTSGEAAKHGVVGYEGLVPLFEVLRNCSGLVLKGLMTVGPLGNDEVRIGKAFASLRQMAEKASTEFAQGLKLLLSMGMSDDYLVAMAEGTNLIRIGTAIFGKRS